MLNLRSTETITFEVNDEVQLRFTIGTITHEMRNKRYRMLAGIRDQMKERGVLDDDGNIAGDEHYHHWREVNNTIDLLTSIESGAIRNGSGKWEEMGNILTDPVAFHDEMPDALLDALAAVSVKHNGGKFRAITEEKKEPTSSE